MKSELPRASSRREPTILLLLILAFCSIYSTWRPIHNVPAIDFYQFWVIGQEISAGRPVDIYSNLERQRLGGEYLNHARQEDDPIRIITARHRRVLETFSTPFLYTTFAAWSSGNYTQDLALYRGASLLFVLLSVAALCHLLGYGLASTIVAITLFGSWFGPLRSDWLVGNVNSIQLGWLVLFLWISSRFPTKLGHLLGGVLLGLGAMWKPNLAIVIAGLQLAWLLRGRHQKFVLESAGIIGGTLAAFAWSSSAFGGPEIWQNWWSALSGLPDHIITVELGNHSPVRLLGDWLQVDMSVGIALACGTVAIAAVARGRSRFGIAENEAPNRRGLEDLHVAALAALIALLASPLSWFHYFVATIPMLLIVLGAASFKGPTTRIRILTTTIAIVSLVAIMVRPLALLQIGSTWDRAVILCLGTSLLFGLGVRELHSLREDSPARSDAP